MHRLLWLYADYWRAARRVLVEGIESELPTLGLAPLRTACDPAVALFVFTDEDGGIGSAGYVSLLTGRVLAQVSLGLFNQGTTPEGARSR